MTDRELLEAAAKAAGLRVRYVGNGEPNDNGAFFAEPDSLWWNPLVDDGDAMRLMMKLKMRVNTDRALTVCAKAHGDRGYTHELIYDDLQHATRRAIVRAAAVRWLGSGELVLPNVGIEPPERSARMTG